MSDIDFKGLADRLLDNAESLLAAWFPNGVASGHEFKIGSVEGEAGDSLSVNMNTGQWADFAGTDKGGDLISLYAARKGLSQLDAARELSGEAARMLAVPPSRPKAPRKTQKWTPILPVPESALSPPDRFARNEGTPKDAKWVDGQFVRRWTYHDAEGRVLGHVARFHWPKVDTETGEITGFDKDVVPQTWCEDEAGNRKWRTRSFPVPRPLYGLRELAERPLAPVLIVEGEKSADAARQIAPQYVVITWPGGAEAWRKAALNPLRGRSLLLWPDADEPGVKAMWEVGHELFKQCPAVKIILPTGKPDGWDAADALADQWGWSEFKEWALPLAVLVTETGANDVRRRHEADAGPNESNDRAGAARDARRPEDADKGRPGRGAGAADQAGDRAHGAPAGAAERRDAGSAGGAGQSKVGEQGGPPEHAALHDSPAAVDSGPVRPHESSGEGGERSGRAASSDSRPAPGPRSDRPDAGDGDRGDGSATGSPGDEAGPVAVRDEGDPRQAADVPAGEPSGAPHAPRAGGTQLPAAAGSEPQSQVARWLAWGLDRNGNGIPLTNLNNAVAIMEHDPRLQGIVWFDEFLQRMLTGDPAREWTDADDANLTLYMQRVIGTQKMGVDTVRQAVRVIAYRNVRNCVSDWLGRLTWDGIARIEQFFPDIFGTDDTAYTRAAGRNFWISLAARSLTPGCQVDNMVVLEGSQGLYKSSALQVIGGEWYAAQHESPSNMRAFAEILQGKIIVEIEEMHAFSRSENEAVKKAITVRKDRFRPSGAHGYAKDHPRTCIFAGTTNRDDWNKDETGARRQWPIRCATVELDLLRANREQFFAEAVARYRQDESWWQMPEEETKAEQQDRYDSDPWMDEIARFIALMSSVTVNEIMQEALKIELARFTRSDQMRVAACLRVLGWKQQNKRLKNQVLKVWTPQPSPVATSQVATEGRNAQVVDSAIPF